MVKVERAHLKNLNELALLFDKYRVFYNRESDIDAAKFFLRERMETKESVIFVSLNDETKMTGFTQLYPLFSSTRMKRLWLLNDLFVDSSHRGKGISVALIDTAKEYSKQTGACGLILETAKANKIGNSLYPRAGFVLDQEHNYYSWDI